MFAKAYMISAIALFSGEFGILVKSKFDTLIYFMSISYSRRMSVINLKLCVVNFVIFLSIDINPYYLIDA